MEAKFCPFCQRKNKADAVRCAHCGVLLIAHKPGAFTTVGISSTPPEKRDSLAPCAERVGQIPQNSFALFVMDFEQPVILENRPRLVIGRDTELPQNEVLDLSRYGDVALGISRRHAQISFTDNAFFLEDLGSTNGTWLNRRRLTPGQKFRLQSDDQIWLGPLKLLFCAAPKETPTEITFSLQVSNSLLAAEQPVTPQFFGLVILPYLEAVAAVEAARAACLEQPAETVHLLSFQVEASKLVVRLAGATETMWLLNKWLPRWREEHLEMVGAAEAMPESEWQEALRPLANSLVTYLQPTLPEKNLAPFAEQMMSPLRVLLSSQLEFSL